MLSLPAVTFDPTKTLFGSKVIIPFTPIVGIKQIETATCAGTVTQAGNITVTVTGAGITGSPVALTVAAALNDTAAQWAQKVRLAIQANSAISALYDVSPSLGTDITLTRKTPAANDATLNIAIANGTTVGVTAAPSSTDTRAGKATGNTFNLIGKVGDYAYKTTTTTRKVPGDDNVNRPDRENTTEAEERMELVDIEEIDVVVENLGGFSVKNIEGTAQVWVVDQDDPTGTSVRFLSDEFKASIKVKDGTTKFGGGDYSKVSLSILSLKPSALVWHPNATSATPTP